MSYTPTQTDREMSVKCALADNTLLFKSMHCSERLGRLSEFRVELASTDIDVKIAEVLGKEMTVSLEGDDRVLRHFHGIVTSFKYMGWRDKKASYEAIIKPALWLLTRSSNCRIFQDMTTIEIVKQVCADGVYGGLIDLDEHMLSGSFAIRTYCVQYRETDFNFFCRLLEEEGIYFYFTHKDGKHTVVLADSYGAHAPASGFATVAFLDEESQRRMTRDEFVTKWQPGGQVQASKYEMNDFDFVKPNFSLTAKSSIAAAFIKQEFEQYDYPGLYSTSEVGVARARARMEALHGQGEEIYAECSARGLLCGALFTLKDHPRADQNREFLITSAETVFRGMDYLSGGDEVVRFECCFTAVGKEHSYRAPPIMRKPFVQGPQTAMVVGPAGDEIYTDAHGRIKVQFHWDRLGKKDDKSSCWVRVSQSWAGAGWGALFIPRVGMEVVVDFLEGDPDQPLVTGCVYNGSTVPPYGLPANKTRSTIMTNSTPGGGGYNEIRFEDKKDAEEIYVQAEKDYNRVVKNNDTLKVGFEKKDKGDQTIAIMNDQSLDVGNNKTVKIGNDHAEDIGNNQTVKIGADQKVDVANTIVIEAGTSIELKVGGSSIKIEGTKITVKSAQIAIESSAATEIKAGATMAIKASAIMTIEGALVKIN